MDFKILCPKLIPESRLIDFPKSNHQPVDKPLITPPPPYMFNSIDYPAESTLYRIRRHRDPAFSLKPVIKNQKGIPRKILDIGSVLRILFRIKSLYQLFKASLDLFDKLHHKLFGQREKQNLLHKHIKRFLLFFFRSILIKEDRKISFSMPNTPLGPHPFSKKIILNPRASVREKHLQLAIIQSLLKIFVNKLPILIHPEPDRLKPSPHPLRGQSLPHLCLIQRGSPRPSET